MKYLQIFLSFFLKCVFLSSWSYLAWDRISLESRNCFLPIIISKRQSLLSSSLINALFKYCLSQLWSISTTFSRASIFVLFITCGNWTLLPLLDTTCKKILINFNSLILDIFPPHHDDCNDDQTNIDNDEMIEEHCETDPAPATCWTCCSKIKNIIDWYQGIISNSNTIISSSVRAYLWLVLACAAELSLVLSISTQAVRQARKILTQAVRRRTQGEDTRGCCTCTDCCADE